MDNSIDQQFIEFIVKSLVGNPDAVVVERRIDEKGVLLELTVDPEDLGRVIGKRGATAQSLRTLLRALGTKNDARYNLKIVDNGEPREDRMASTAPADDTSAATTDDVNSTSTASKAQDDDLDDLRDGVEITRDDKDEPESDVISRARKELADLDDLDV